MWGRGPHIFTEQGPIGFKSGAVHSFILTLLHENVNTYISLCLPPVKITVEIYATTIRITESFV